MTRPQPTTSAGDAETVLAAHQLRHSFTSHGGSRPAGCTCGEAVTVYGGFLDWTREDAAHRTHLAAVLATLLADVRREERDRWTDWLASIGYGIDYGAIGGAEPPCSLAELSDAYVRITGDEDRGTWAWTIEQETGVLHDCATCTNCLHDGSKCCGCYDGACCREARGGAR